MRRTLLFFAVLGLAACAEPEDISIDYAPLVTASEPPGIGFYDVDAFVSPGELAGWVTDDDQAASTVPIVLTSDLAGELWRGNANGAGTWIWQGELEQGDHVLSLSATDREGNVVTETISLPVRTNTQPSCEIMSPRDGSVYTTRDSILFEATAYDTDGDPLVLLWRSSVQGALFEGSTFRQRLTVPGDHIVSVEAMDQVGQPCIDEVLVQILE